MWRRRAVGIALCTGLVIAAAGCGGRGASPSASAASTPQGRTSASGTVWLCRPGQADDPCTTSQATTVVPPGGARTTQVGHDNPASRFDCFYVYPTVSTQKTLNANLQVQPAEIGVAIAQVSRFSSVCRVWAPMYEQRTVASLAVGLGVGRQADEVAYNSVLSAWKDYLAHDNRGRPVVFIGHSQGSAMLIRLLSSQVDPNPALRRRTVLAVLLGGNVTVPTGKTVGATFHHLPLCTASADSHCVIAYSSFPSQPPPDSLFGIPGQGVSFQSGQTASSGVQVACVNPAALGGGTADLEPYFLTATSAPSAPPVTTPWITYPHLYSASCAHGGGATWLQVDTLDVAGRPVVSEPLGPTWGFHLADVNLTLGNLVGDVTSAERTYSTHH